MNSVGDIDARRPATVGQARRWAQEQLLAADIENGRREADWLLAHVMGQDSWLRLQLVTGQEFPADRWDELRRLVLRRTSQEPLQYILGTAEFCGLELEVGPGVLIPRPETERLVELAKELYTGSGGICDLCTGTGAVALALAAELPPTDSIVAVDCSPAALTYAARNKARLRDRRVQFVLADLFEAFAWEARFSLVTANPPYVAPAEYETLPPDVRDYEPALALLAGEGGLAVFRRIVERAPRHLAAAGWLISEIGEEQGEAAAEILRACGYRCVRIARDYAGRDRFAIGRAP